LVRGEDDAPIAVDRRGVRHQLEQFRVVCKRAVVVALVEIKSRPVLIDVNSRRGIVIKPKPLGEIADCAINVIRSASLFGSLGIGHGAAQIRLGATVETDPTVADDLTAGFDALGKLTGPVGMRIEAC
jgi:hypothetical protein